MLDSYRGLLKTAFHALCKLFYFSHPMFEEEYSRLVSNEFHIWDEDYNEYLRRFYPQDVHRGYFSIDKKTNRIIDGKVEKKTGLSDDISAYELILKNKERLLSFEEPTRFIFSHSALREGWDNPNVFQICTLRHSNSLIFHQNFI